MWREEARIAIEFFDRLRLPDVAGMPAMAEAAGDWWREIMAALFGSLDPVTNIRWIEEIFCLVPKKNSKTTNGAGLMLTALFMNRRPRAEFLFVGPTQAISDLAYSQASGMIEADPDLQRRYQVRDHIKEIRDRVNSARLKIKTFDLKILTGPRPAGVFVDELHLLGRQATASKVIRQLRGGRQSNPEGFMMFATTMPDEPPSGVFLEELMTARAIRDGRMPGKMLAITYELPEDLAQPAKAMGEPAPWEDPAVWPMVLPNLGRSLRLNSLIEDFATERTKGESAIRVWASQHLNIEIGLALRSDRWAGADFWERQADPLLTLESILERSEVVCVGIDGGGLDDLLGLAVLGRDAKTRDWLLWSHAWAHISVLERRKSEASRLKDFEARGDLTIVAELGEDVRELAEICATVEATGRLAMVGLDPVGIGAVVDGLAEKGIEGNRVVGVTQGWKLTGAIKTAERKLAEGTLWHCGQPLMAWSVGNARVEPKGNAIVITKQASGTAKIDPLMAALDAVSLMSTNPEAQPPPFYERHGLLVLGQ